MSLSAVLHAKTEEMNSNEKRAMYTVCVVGCKPIGITHAYLFAAAGFKVICADPDQNATSLLARGKAPGCELGTETKLRAYLKTGQLVATSDVKTAVSQSDVVAVTTPVEIDKKRKIDRSDLEKTCKLVGSQLRKGALVIIVSTVGLGTVENVLKEILENASGLKVGTDFGLAYSPDQALQEKASHVIKDNDRVVAASDVRSLNVASTILEITLGKNVKRTDTVKVAEAAALFKKAQKDTSVALANELAHFCEKASIDYLEVQRLANTDSFCELSTPTLSGGSMREEPYLLLEDAENLNVKLRMVQTAKETNALTIKQTANLVADALKSCGKPLRRARVSILGVSQTQNTRSVKREALKDLVSTLESRGARISLYDPYFSDLENTETEHQYKKSLTEAIEGADCLLIVTGHDQFKRLNLKKTRAMLKTSAAIIDLEGVFDPGKVEKEGLVYRGLGRGVWTR